MMLATVGNPLREYLKWMVLLLLLWMFVNCDAYGKMSSFSLLADILAK